MPRCTKCGEDHPLTREFFYPSKQTKSGFRFQCIKCEAEYRRANKERNIEYQRRYHIENREKLSQDSKRYAESHKDEIKAYQQEYHKRTYGDNKQGMDN